ncbi:MAG TPA: DUF4838 domain-containing protein [Planctomycetota bacterium]|nr:DUF4838 domain-containing protein [Planctomycetota bacterium]
MRHARWPLVTLLIVGGALSAADLVIAENSTSTTTIVIAPAAGRWEAKAAAELTRVITLISGATVPVLAPDKATSDGPVIYIGSAALAALPSLHLKLAGVTKPTPVVRADAIVVYRDGQHLYLAGSNDESHYYAVMYLLQHWGCRWYVPTDFGECIPERATLTIGALDMAYAPPFEIRHYWLSWNADGTGAEDFRHRNFMNESSLAGMGHALGQYTQSLVPPGKTLFNVPLAEATTATAVADRIDADYAKGVPGISLAIEDGNYTSDSPRDLQLQAGIQDKYALQPSNTDAMMALYNQVGRILRERHPSSPTRIGGMAYANVTIPPQQITTVEPNVVMWLAPIDIDPNHGMDSPESPPRQEYHAMLTRWAELMSGRLVIYDYDQGQLVWRDLPNPSHMAFAQDVRHYRAAKILGIGTESRGATATTFLNLFFRGQLMWNPDADVAALLTEFYPAFYGPAAEPMAAYWGAIYEAWDKTLVTEHEFPVAPAIYTPELVATLRGHLARAQQALGSLPGKAMPSRNEQLFLQRLRFTQQSFTLIEGYQAMVQAAAGHCDFAAAITAGERGLAARELLTTQNPTFTTYKNIGENGPAWWPGDVEYLRELAALTTGSKGTLIAPTPLSWAFRRDPNDTGLARGWYLADADLTWWKTTGSTRSISERLGDPQDWEMLRTDLYLQAQGIRHADRQSYTGHYWYQATMDLTAEQIAGAVHLNFPGLFNTCWLYVDDQLVAYRPFPEPWWRNDYRFAWDVDLTGKLQPGKNRLTLRGYCPLHFGGMFRRPFLYRVRAP